MTYNQLCSRLAPVCGADEARAVVRTVLDTVFGMSLADICCGKVTQLSADETTRLEKIMERLEKSEPVQYVLGEAWFKGRRFGVAPGVLIPRPETEGLVDWLCEGAPRRPAILDIGTGSGCIAITAALELPGAEVTAWDLSDDALATARANASRLGADVRFVRQDALHAPTDRAVQENHSDQTGQEDQSDRAGQGLWDAVVSNPPYIRQCERTDMAANVLDHEPEMALFVPDSDPLLFYRAITLYAARTLRPGGRLLFETNTAFARDVARLLDDCGFTDVEVRDDCFGKPRMAGGKK